MPHHVLTRAAVLGTIVAAAALLGASPAVAAQPAPPAPPTDSPQQATPAERAAATIRPAIVYIHGVETAWVVDEHGVALNNGKPFTLNFACTGFGVNPDGYVATAAHCADPTFNRPEFIQRAAATMAPGAPRPSDIKQSAVDPTTPLSPADQLLVDGMANWSVEGSNKGSPPDLTLSVVGDATSNAQIPTPALPPAPPVPPGQALPAPPGQGLPAHVVDFQPVDNGDVALLKIEATDLPSALLATDSDVQIGTPLLAVGYPGSADSLTDSSAEPSVKNGEVSSKRTEGSVPFYEVSAPLTHGMSGGPTIDLDARVLGVNHSLSPDEPQPFNFVAPSFELSELLARNGVPNELGPDDVAYRSALADYYAGHYTQAIAGFDRLLQTHPDHGQATQFKILATKARDKFGDAVAPNAASQTAPAPRPYPALLWALIGAAAATVLFGGTLAAVLLFRRRKTSTGAVSIPSQRDHRAAVAPAQPDGAGTPPAPHTLLSAGQPGAEPADQLAAVGSPQAGAAAGHPDSNRPLPNGSAPGGGPAPLPGNEK